jgi:hypothetical protein
VARRHGYRIAEVPAQVSDSHSYKVAKVRLLRDSLRMFFEILRIRCYSLRGDYDGGEALRSAASTHGLPDAPGAPHGAMPCPEAPVRVDGPSGD